MQRLVGVVNVVRHHAHAARCARDAPRLQGGNYSIQNLPALQQSHSWKEQEGVARMPLLKLMPPVSSLWLLVVRMRRLIDMELSRASALAHC